MASTSGILVVEPQGGARQPQAFGAGRFEVGGPAVDELPEMAPGAERMGQRIVRLQRDRALGQASASMPPSRVSAHTCGNARMM